MMQIDGITRLSLQDYPGELACILFTPGCPFRCPYCHNAPLAAKDHNNPGVSVSEVLNFLQSRKGQLEGVCITGGEPLMQPDLGDFLAQVKMLGYRIKLDTNGFYPTSLQALIQAKVVDYIAMDIKHIPARYYSACGLQTVSTDRIQHSIRLIQQSGLPHEFRMTVVRELHAIDEISRITEWGLGTSPLILQRYQPSETQFQPNLNAMSAPEWEHFQQTIAAVHPTTTARGM